MISGKEFVKKIKNENSELFNQSRSNVRRFFASNPSKEHMIEHFTGRMVKEVIEHISGKTVDVVEAFATEAASPQAKGAGLLDKYEASSDPAALAAYQLVAEGRAEAVWNEMSECVEDQFISSRYAAIAKDEGFHANIGGWKLEKLVEGSAELQDRILAMVSQMRSDLLEISNKNTAVAA